MAHARTIYTTNVTGVQDAINQALGASARSMAIQSACCSGMDAIGFAAEMISNGEVDMAICGGTEAPLHRFPMLEFRLAGMTPFNSEMPERVARPFDLWRTTGVVSEGATMLVIEPEDSPRPGYSFISGYGFAHDEADDLCGGMAMATRQALAQARLRPAQIEVINAWGPGPSGDRPGRIRSAGRRFFRRFCRRFRRSPSRAPSAARAPGAAPAIQVATAALSQRFWPAIPPR